MNMPKGPASGHPARRKEIVDAARAIAAEQGWAAVTVRALGARIGCSAPAIYQYFRDKDAVLGALAAEGQVLLADSLAKAAAEQTGAGKRLRAVVRAFWSFGLANRELYAAIFGLDGLSPHLDGQARGPTPGLLVGLAGDLLSKRDGDGRPEDLADRLLATMHGFLSLVLSGSLGNDNDRAYGLLSDVVDAIIKDVGRH